MRESYTVSSVLNVLRNKLDLIIKDNEIYVLNGKSKNNHSKRTNDLGNKSWGKIDFLTKYCGYKLYFVADFPKFEF